MGRADSTLQGRMIFSFGVPRSGTYWLQRIVTAHPEVSEVPSETQLFYRGIDPLLKVFHHGARGSWTPGEMYVDRDLLLDATRDFCDSVLVPFLAPGARYVAERTSLHVRCVDTIAAVYPDAHLLHIVRDGRDVARSLIGREWGPATVAEAAEHWRSGIVSAREGAPPERYREIRYEELLADPGALITDLYEWLDLPTGPDAIKVALSEARLGRNEDPKDPRLAAGKWRDSFSPEALSAFMDVAGELLLELGYEEAEALPTPPAAPVQEARGGRLRTALGSRLSRRAGSAQPDGQPGPAQPGPAQPDGEALPTFMRAQQTVDGILKAIHAGPVERLSEHVDDDIRTLIVGHGEELRLYGAAALMDWLRSEPVTSARQLRADPHPGLPSYSVVLSYLLPDGSVEDRLLELSLRGSKVEALTVYRFPLAT